MSNSALENAKAWCNTIEAYVEGMTDDFWESLESLRDDPTSDPAELARIEGVLSALDNPADSDDAREQAEQSALEVSVRSGWGSPGDALEPVEYQILLTTGGPALRIRGTLGRYGDPVSARLEWQDWGTPWTEYHEADEATLVDFASVFYFGE